MQTETRNLETGHAKLLQHAHRQVLAYLFRHDDDDALCVALQLWVAVSDEQIRAVAMFDDDDQTLAFFDHLSSETIGAVLDQMGILHDIEKLEDALS